MIARRPCAYHVLRDRAAYVNTERAPGYRIPTAYEIFKHYKINVRRIIPLFVPRANFDEWTITMYVALWFENSSESSKITINLDWERESETYISIIIYY